MIKQNGSKTADGQSRNAPIQPSPPDDSIQDLELAGDTAAGVTGGNATGLNFGTVQVTYNPQASSATRQSP
jgi:hypothetical protein